jgi:hypothetical protein
MGRVLTVLLVVLLVVAVVAVVVGIVKEYRAVDHLRQKGYDTYYQGGICMVHTQYGEIPCRELGLID